MRHNKAGLLTRSIGLAAVGVLALSACSGGDNPETTPENGNETTTESGAAQEPVSISYLHRLPDGDGMTKVAELTEQWNKENPNIQVTATKFDGAAAEMLKKLETDINANVGTCLAQLGYAEVPEMFAKGLAVDVSELADKYKSNFEGTSELMRVGDAVVGLPQDTGPLVYYYNKAEFEALGLTVPTTTDEFIEQAKKSAEAGKYIAAFQPDEVPNWLSGQAAAAGSSWYNPVNDEWVVTVTDEGSERTAAFWQELLDSKAAVVHERWGESFGKALNDGELIGTIGAAWEAPLLADNMAGTANEGNWAVTQLPDFGAGELTGPDGGSGVAVLKGCEFPEQAMEFNNWLNTQVDALASQGLVVATSVSVPSTPDAIAAFYGGQDVLAELGEANKRLSPNFNYMPYFSTVQDPMKKAASAAADGSGKVADIFTAAQEQSVQSLKDAGLPVAE